MEENALSKSIWANQNLKCTSHWIVLFENLSQNMRRFFHKLLLFNSNACCNLYIIIIQVIVTILLFRFIECIIWRSMAVHSLLERVERRTLEQRSKIKIYYKLHDQRCIEKFRERARKKKNAVIITVCFVLLQNRIMYTAHAPRTQSPNNNILAESTCASVSVFACKIRWQ